MLELKAHAKVNLGLSVLAKRGDGYHEIDTLMARLELHDRLWLEPRASGVSLEVGGADLPAGRDNLAYRAAEAYLEQAGAGRGVHIRLEKAMPIAAGLGGGSSDAAGVLRGLSRLYPAGLDLLPLAQALGSDVPFFAQDVPAARARGRGEKLEPLTLPALHLVLVNPGIRVSAKDAYLNLQNFSPRLKPHKLILRLERGDEPGYLNALQPGVLMLAPAIRQLITALREAGLRGVLMTGSGATCFGLAEDAAHAERVAAELAHIHPEWWIRASRGC